MSAFDHPLVLKNIQDQDIDYIEQSIREKRFKEVQNPQLLERIDTKLAANLDKFEFKRGERVLIKAIAAHVKSKNVQYFASTVNDESQL